MDETIRPGSVWSEELRSRIAHAAAMIAVIGPEWLFARDDFGRRRLDQEDDWVRQEIAGALTAGINLIPVLFKDAQMPLREALPPSIAGGIVDSHGRATKGLPDFQYVPIRDHYWDHDIELLISQVEQFLRREHPQVGRPRLYPYPTPGVNPAPLAEEELRAILRDRLPSWTLVESPLPQDPTVLRQELHRTYDFASFLDAVSFMNLTAPACQLANHHPRWENIYATLFVYWTTWDIGHKPSKLDVQMAEYFELTYSRFPAVGSRQPHHH